MAKKKKKNLKHTEAVNRREQAEAEMSKLGLKLSDDLAAIGFVFSHLAVSHLVYCGLNSINCLCRDYAGVDVCIFSQHIIAPCLIPLCSVYGVVDLTRWKNDPLITTSIGTTIDALATNAPNIYHYAFDPEFIDNNSCDSQDLHRAFCDPRVKVIVRHESHAKLIEAEFGIFVCDIVVPDCDAVMLAKFVLTEMKNERKSNATDKDEETRTRTGTTPTRV